MQENRLTVTGNGNIVMQYMQGNTITITQNDPQLLEKLQKLRNEDIAVLQKMINEQTDTFSQLFKTMVSGLVSQKNIVEGTISDADEFSLGDGH